jgi:hypothetical protein
MGSKFFRPSEGSAVSGSNLNMEARSFGSAASLGQKAGGRAQKDVAAAQAAYKGGLKPTTKDAAADAPGPKKV